MRSTQYSGRTITSFSIPPFSHHQQIAATVLAINELKRLLLVYLSRAVAIARTTPSRGVPPANRLDQRPLVASLSLPIQACFPYNPSHRLRGVSSNSEEEEAYLDYRFFFSQKKSKRKERKGTKREEAHHPSPK